MHQDKSDKKFQWSKFITVWILLLDTYVVYHGIQLCYKMIEYGSTSYSFGWLATLITAVIGLGNVVLCFYFNKSKAENLIKLENSAAAPPNIVIQDDSPVNDDENSQYYP